MNAVDIAASASVRRRADLRTVDRVVAAVLMPIGPAAVAVLRFVIPGEPVGASVAAAPDAQRAVMWLGTVAVFTLLPGVFAALHALRRSAPRLTAWAAALLIPGYLGMTALLATDAFAMASYDIGLDPDEVDRIHAALMGLPTMTILLIVFVFGHIVGTVLLGITMIVSRTASVLVGVAMAISQPLHFVALVVFQSRILDLIAWGTTAVCMGVLAWHVLRTPDDEWDLPPLPVGSASR